MGISDAGLIAMSLISLAGMVLLYTLSNRTWFKRQNFKVELFNIKATNKLNLKQLEKKLGLTSNKSVADESAAAPLGGIEKLLPLLKNLDGDALTGLVETYIGSRGETSEGGGPIDMLMGFAEDHPEVVQSLLKGLTSGGDNAEEQGQYQV